MVKYPSEATLQAVALENIRNNQIGGMTDGISEEAARDLGFTVSPHEVAQIVADREQRAIGAEASTARTETTSPTEVEVISIEADVNPWSAVKEALPTTMDARRRTLPASVDSRVEHRRQIFETSND